jgi:hypothetical protein
MIFRPSGENIYYFAPVKRVVQNISTILLSVEGLIQLARVRPSDGSIYSFACVKRVVRNISTIFMIPTLLVCALTGCIKQELPVLQTFEPVMQQRSCRIAVLPFVNNSEFSAGGNMATRILQSQLNGLDNVELVQEGDIRNYYQQLSVYPGQRLTFEEQQILARNLDIQFFIDGTVIAMADGRDDQQNGTPLFVVEINVIDAGQGRDVATVYHRRQGSDYCQVLHFGCLNTLTELVYQTFKEVLQKWKKEKFLLYFA